jgi:integrase
MARAKKDKNGYFYEVLELAPGPGGKRRRKYIRAKTAALLKEKIAKFHSDQEQGIAPIRDPREHSLASWLKEWLASEQQRGTIRPSTYRRYEMDIRNHLIPTIGHIKLSALTLDDVQRCIDNCALSGKQPRKEGEQPGPLAPRSVRNILTPLQEALAAAKRRKLVREHVALDVELPEPKRPNLYKLRPAEMRRFLKVVRRDRFEALYWLAALGMREGELLGLRWANVNLQARTVRVVEAMQRVKGVDGKSTMQWVSVKTENSRRTILLPEDWVHVLLAHKDRQDEDRSVASWQEHDLVFPSTCGTPMEAQNLVNRHFKPALKRADLPVDKIRFHDLRHAAASMFIALGYDARTVADILGHSSPDFTLRQYAHSFEEVRQRAVADVGKLLRDEERVLELPTSKARQEVE